jgi:hypothetical protein
MASLRVPKEYYSGLAQILSLSDVTVREIASVLEGTPLSLTPRKTLENALAQIDAISAKDASSISGALASLYLAHANADKPISDFVNDVVKSVERGRSEELKLTNENLDDFKQRLTILLDVNPLAVSSKAVSVWADNERAFSRARVLTDVRAAFGTNPTDAPSAAVIVHTLNIHYFQDERHREFYVALDAKDVQDLIDVLGRAKSKAESLKALIPATGMTYLEPAE